MDDLQLVWSIGAIAFVFKVFDWLTTPKPTPAIPPIPEGFDIAIGEPVIAKLANWHAGTIVGYASKQYVVKLAGGMHSFETHDVIRRYTT